MFDGQMLLSADGICADQSVTGTAEYVRVLAEGSGRLLQGTGKKGIKGPVCSTGRSFTASQGNAGGSDKRLIKKVDKGESRKYPPILDMQGWTRGLRIRHPGRLL